MKIAGLLDHDADEMDYEGGHDYLDFLATKHSQGLHGILDDGTNTNINTDGGAETSGEGTGAVMGLTRQMP